MKVGSGRGCGCCSFSGSNSKSLQPTGLFQSVVLIFSSPVVHPQLTMQGQEETGDPFADGPDGTAVGSH